MAYPRRKKSTRSSSKVYSATQKASYYRNKIEKFHAKYGSYGTTAAHKRKIDFYYKQYRKFDAGWYD